MAEITRLLLLLWVGVTVSAEVDLQKRIIGGRMCGPTQRLYHVLLIANHGSGESFCGGSLISDRWILTAAHCWMQGWTMTAHLGVHPRIGGNYEQMEITAPPEKRIDRSGTHDIMLLRLPRPTAIRPVALPACGNKPNLNADVEIAGYASTIMGPNNQRIPGKSTTIQCANTRVADCQGLGFITYPPQTLYQHLFCGRAPGVDVCLGDSGGGVVYNNMIYGVISFTGDGNRACAAPAGFMDVCEYMVWINGVIAGPRNG